ncbi:GIY-YIG nuclease family protein [Vibrio parahaemolyticus]|nr:GIY-YIG nuclease family protein [Vibrio parahaemolyticus]EIV1599680.1 GIY-YIG nuclease family protein [Vibrio parahaemolyticus]
MFLNFGIDENNEIVFVDKVESGKTNLVCPFCKEPLQAKKGKVKEHHFAHIGETCRDSKNAVAKTNIPLFDTFTLLTKPELKFIERLTTYGYKNMYSFTGSSEAKDTLLNLGLIEEVQDYNHRNYQSFIDDLALEMPGMVADNQPSPELEKLFKIIEKHSNTKLLKKSIIDIKLSKAYRDNDFETKTNLVDLPRIQQFWIDTHRARLELTEPELLPFFDKRVEHLNNQSLYLLRCSVMDGEDFYKIGMTTRPIEERVEEVKRDLKKHVELEDVEVYFNLSGLGRVERLLHKHFTDRRKAIGSFTEYFDLKGYHLDNLLQIAED